MSHVRKAYINNSKTPRMYFLGLTVILLVLFIIPLFGSLIAFADNTNSSYEQADITYKRFTVQKGDTLWDLAAKNNDNQDITKLIRKTISYNNLSSTYIQPGQVIYIPVRL